MELGVTDEVAFELKYPIREEIILQEESIKRKLAEAEQANNQEDAPEFIHPSEEQLELF